MELAGVLEGDTVRLNARALDLGDRLQVLVQVQVQVTLDSHSAVPARMGDESTQAPAVLDRRGSD